LLRKNQTKYGAMGGITFAEARSAAGRAMRQRQAADNPSGALPLTFAVAPAKKSS
jgi:hypothetical protein